MSADLPILRSAHMSWPEFSRQPQTWKDRVLGTICLSAMAEQHAAEAGNMPFVPVLAPLMHGESASCEIWFSDQLPMQGQSAGIRYRHDNATLFGVIALAESALAGDPAPNALQRATESAYKQIFALLDTLNYPCMYRFWNYMANINGTLNGLERYRQFNIGRQDAFIACGREVSGQLPAACALGVAQGPLTIAFLAGRAPSHAIENPRQLSAYEYPQQYGPRSPTFSRANLLRTANADVLLISGTASIVGHQTLHLADAVAQAQESLANIKAVISEANRVLNQQVFDPVQASYRVYVRHAADMPLIRQELLQAMGAGLQAIFVQADICRTDLLVEIEATVMATTALREPIHQ